MGAKYLQRKHNSHILVSLFNHLPHIVLKGFYNIETPVFPFYCVKVTIGDFMELVQYSARAQPLNKLQCN